MKKFLQEFKAFALRGNVLDLAVGVLIGGAFSSLVTSLTPVSYTHLYVRPEGRARIWTDVSAAVG